MQLFFGDLKFRWKMGQKLYGKYSISFIEVNDVISRKYTALVLLEKVKSVKFP